MSNRKQQQRRLFATLAILALVLMVFAPAALAAGPTVTVVASGLDNPRGLAFGPEGALYVAEAGTGGAVCGIPSPEGESCFGNTGAITRVWKGSQERIATGLPSLASPGGTGAIGPVGISFQGRGGAYVIVGLGGNPANRSGLGPEAAILGQLVRLLPDGRWQAVADVAGYEAEANPDGAQVDSNPYAVLALPGKQIVADAGGNALVQRHASGSISTLATFAPDGGAEAVPTSVALGPDGAYYVGQLTGVPFPVGAAKVYRVPAGGGPAQVYASGFTNIIGLAFAKDGSLYVLEIDHDSLAAGAPFGALLRVPAGGGSPENLNVPGLVMPGGLAIGPDGALYVSNYSVFPGQGPFPGNGEVLRIAF